MGITDVASQSARSTPVTKSGRPAPLEQEDLLGRLAEAESAADYSAALIDLLGRLDSATSVRHACYTLANDLHEFFGCRRVILGLRRGASGKCRLQAVSGIAQFDRRSDVTKAMEAAFDEATIRRAVIRWPPANDSERYGSLTLRKLASLDESAVVVCAPLRGRDGEAIGAWAFCDDGSLGCDTERLKLIDAFERPVASRMAALQRAEPSSLTRWRRSVGARLRTWKGKLMVLACCIVLAALAIPLPYKMKCDCTVEPVTRRFVAAPFKGTLDESLVKPGELVEKDDVLARMDGREIRWQRAGVVADRQQAEKRRDAELADQNYAEAQIARLEVERLDLQIRLLDHRSKNLSIRSPIDGIVTSGDLERAQGAPLDVGETLFEIAPLNQMIIEIAIPDDEVAHATVGQEAIIRLDAYPGESWTVTLDLIHPRAEIRDHENVFVAEAKLENSDLRLRPGMNGRAKVVAPARSLGWILFHKPWNATLAWLGY